MLDATAQHPGRTGKETLRLAASVLGVGAGRADDQLDRVGLGRAGSQRVGRYSLGMRQRLGIAVALLGEPAAMVLDEPANGLDPEGIRWMRGLIREFADAGGTVLLSSHLLAEVQATADQLVVISRGHVVAHGSPTQLLGTWRTAPGADVVVRALDQHAMAAALEQAGLPCTEGPGGTLRVRAPVEDVGRVAAAAGQVLTELGTTPVGTTRIGSEAVLEDWFLALTAGAPA